MDSALESAPWEQLSSAQSEVYGRFMEDLMWRALRHARAKADGAATADGTVEVAPAHLQSAIHEHRCDTQSAIAWHVARDKQRLADSQGSLQMLNGAQDEASAAAAAAAAAAPMRERQSGAGGDKKRSRKDAPKWATHSDGQFYCNGCAEFGPGCGGPAGKGWKSVKGPGHPLRKHWSGEDGGDKCTVKHHQLLPDVINYQCGVKFIIIMPPASPP